MDFFCGGGGGGIQQHIIHATESAGFQPVVFSAPPLATYVVDGNRWICFGVIYCAQPMASG
jgi:hypothetical protein